MRRLLALTAVAAALMAALVTAPPAGAAPNRCSTARDTRPERTWLAGAITSGSPTAWFRFATTARRWTLLTLGDLTGDLSLRLYDGACHEIAASDHRGTRFEEISRDLAAGRYYARVSSVAGARGTYRLRFRGLRAGTDVLSSHVSVQDGTHWIAGEVLNDRNHPWFIRWADLTTYDKAGHVLRREDDLAFPLQYVGAHRRAQFYGEFARPAGYDHYRVTVVSERPQSVFPPPAPATLVRSATFTDRYGRRDYSGTIRNDGKQSIPLTLVMTTIYGSRGQVLYMNTAGVRPTNLRPGHVGRYDVLFTTDAGVNAVGERTVN